MCVVGYLRLKVVNFLRLKSHIFGMVEKNLTEKITKFIEFCKREKCILFAFCFNENTTSIPNHFFKTLKLDIRKSNENIDQARDRSDNKL